MILVHSDENRYHCSVIYLRGKASALTVKIISCEHVVCGLYCVEEHSFYS